MSKIEKMMLRDYRCPDCGALLQEHNACGNCGYEDEPVVDSESVILFAGQADARAWFGCALSEESQAA